MNHAIGSGFAGLLALVLGILVLSKSQGLAERKVFAWLCLTMFGWLFGYSFMEASSSYDRALLFGRIGHSSAILAPIVYLHFTRYLLKLQWLTRLSLAYYVVGLPFLFLTWSPHYYPLIPRVVKQPWGFYVVGSAAMLIDALICLAVVFFCWTLFFLSCRKAKRTGDLVEYNRLKWCSIALAIFSLGALDYLPKFGVAYYPLGFITTTIFVSLVSYAILAHQLMDIRIVIRKSLVYSILIACIAVTYLMVVLIAEKYFQWLMGYHSLGATLLVAFLTAIFFNPLRNRIQAFVDHALFRATPIELAEENKRLMQEVSQSEKLKSVAALTAGMAHEIKNPLCAIKTFVEYVPERHNDPEFQEIFSRIVPKEVNRIHALVQRLLDFAKPSPANKRLVRASFLIDETLEFLSAALLEKRIQIIRAYSECDTLYADPIQMKQVFLNLLLNSIDAMEGPGNISVSTIQENAHIEVLVTDTGRGISRKDLERVSEPFYTTKSNGTGLGLSIVRNIIQEHEGRMEIESCEGLGTTVRITLPCAHEVSTDEAPEAAQSLKQDTISEHDLAAAPNPPEP